MRDKAVLLERHYLSLRAADPDYVEQLAGELLSALDADAEPATAARLLLGRARLNIRLSRHAAAERDLREALRFAEQGEDKELTADVLARFGALSSSRGDGKRAVGYLERALSICEGQSPQRIKILEYLSGALAMQGQLLPALEHLKDAYAGLDRVAGSQSLSTLYMSFGYLYSQMQLYDKALEYFERSLQAARESGNALSEAISLRNIAEVYQCQQRNPDLVLATLQRVQALLPEIGHPSTEGAYALSCAKAHFALGDYAAVEDYVAESQAIAERHGMFDLLAALRLMRARLRIAQGQPAEAHLEALAGRELAQRYGYESEAIESLQYLAEAHAALGDFRLAYDTMREYSRLNDARLKAQREHAMREALAQLDIAGAQHQARLAEANASMLSQQIDSTRRELQANVLQVARHNEVLREIQQSVKNTLNADPQLARVGLHGIVRTIDNRLQDEKSWQHFVEQTRHLQSDFLTALTSACKELTPTEMKVCTLIRLQLPGKQICSILGIAPRSIENYRYRIRKKLRLQSGQSLAAFLNTIA